MEKNIRKDLSNLLKGAIFMNDLKEAYKLTVHDIHLLQMHQRTINNTYEQMVEVLSFADKRRKTIFFKVDDIVEPHEEGGDYCFLANLSYTYSQVFPECEDNHDVGDLLEKEGVVGSVAQADHEMCCCYWYFPTMESAVDFIGRLNAFFVKRLQG